jgi:serine/threonine-protein kinase RsbW
VSTPAARTEESLQLEASLGALADVRAFLRTALGGLGADRRTIGALVQCVDEWVTNVVVHGYAGATGPVSVTARRDADDVVVTVRDEAPPYDPATAPGFDPDVPLERRPFGGMGIALIRDLCADFGHRALTPTGNEVTMRRAALTGGTQ